MHPLRTHSRSLFCAAHLRDDESWKASPSAFSPRRALQLDGDLWFVLLLRIRVVVCRSVNETQLKVKLRWITSPNVRRRREADTRTRQQFILRVALARIWAENSHTKLYSCFINKKFAPQDLGDKKSSFDIRPLSNPSKQSIFLAQNTTGACLAGSHMWNDKYLLKYKQPSRSIRSKAFWNRAS